MATARNDITGAAIITKTPTDAYRDNWDAIFGKKTGGEACFGRTMEYTIEDQIEDEFMRQRQILSEGVNNVISFERVVEEKSLESSLLPTSSGI